MADSQRGTCIKCAQSVPQRKGGEARQHRAGEPGPDGWKAGEWCDGSGLLTVEAKAAADGRNDRATVVSGKLPELPYHWAMFCSSCGVNRWDAEPHFGPGGRACPGVFLDRTASSDPVGMADKRTLAETFTLAVFCSFEANVQPENYADWAAWGVRVAPTLDVLDWPRALRAAIHNTGELVDVIAYLEAGDLVMKMLAGQLSAMVPPAPPAPPRIDLGRWPIDMHSLPAAPVSVTLDVLHAILCIINEAPGILAKEVELSPGPKGWGEVATSRAISALVHAGYVRREGRGRLYLAERSDGGAPPELAPEADPTPPPHPEGSAPVEVLDESSVGEVTAAPVEAPPSDDEDEGPELDPFSGLPERMFSGEGGIMDMFREPRPASDDESPPADGLSINPPIPPAVASSSRFPVVDLDIGAVCRRPELQARAAMDQDRVNDYRDALVEGIELPPIIVFGDVDATVSHPVWLADGWYRMAAHLLALRRTIRAEVRPGGTREAFLYALSANSTHGLPRSNADKRRAVTLALTDREVGAMSDHKVAALCAVTQPFVSKVRHELEEDAAAKADAANQGETDNGYRSDPDDDTGEHDREPQETERIESERQPSPAPSAPEPPSQLPNDKRAENDAYYTPRKFARACVKWLDEHLPQELNADHIVESAVGDGAWVDAIREVWPGARIDRVDVDPNARGLTLQVHAGDQVIVGDWMQVATDPCEINLGNPYYDGDTLSWLQKCLDSSIVVGQVLRETVLGDTSKDGLVRLPWWLANQPAWVLKLSPRPLWEGPGARDTPDFSDSLFVVWIRGWTEPTRFGWLDCREPTP